MWVFNFVSHRFVDYCWICNKSSCCEGSKAIKSRTKQNLSKTVFEKQKSIYKYKYF